MCDWIAKNMTILKALIRILVNGHQKNLTISQKLTIRWLTKSSFHCTYLRIRFQLTIDIDTLNEYRIAELKFPLFFFSTWIFLISLQCIGCDSIGDFILLWCNSTFHCLRVSHFNKIKIHKYGSQVLLILWIGILLFGRQLDKKYPLIFTFIVSFALS